MLIKEKRLVFKQSRAKLLNPITTSEERHEILLNTEDTAKWETGRREAVSKETHFPFRNIISSTRKALGAVFLDLPKAAIKKTAGFTTDVATNIVAIPANVGRWAFDLIRLIPRALLIPLDYIPEKTFGSISRIMRSTNEKVHKTLGTTPSFAAPK